MEARQLNFNFENNPQANPEALEKERNELAEKLNIYGGTRQKMYKINDVWMIGDQTAEAYAQMLETLDQADENLPYYQGQR